ncbi:hypothetical protein NEOKW01_1697 [Nematocida sp. AWRm80]|nr:hypothetical protein NEOKW01_1697 [Nematocida sp. AWRm80]
MTRRESPWIKKCIGKIDQHIGEPWITIGHKIQNIYSHTQVSLERREELEVDPFGSHWEEIGQLREEYRRYNFIVSSVTNQKDNTIRMTISDKYTNIMANTNTSALEKANKTSDLSLHPTELKDQNLKLIKGYFALNPKTQMIELEILEFHIEKIGISRYTKETTNINNNKKIKRIKTQALERIERYKNRERLEKALKRISTIKDYTNGEFITSIIPIEKESITEDKRENTIQTITLDQEEEQPVDPQIETDYSKAPEEILTDSSIVIVNEVPISIINSEIECNTTDIIDMGSELDPFADYNSKRDKENSIIDPNSSKQIDLPIEHNEEQIEVVNSINIISEESGNREIPKDIDQSKSIDRVEDILETKDIVNSIKSIEEEKVEEEKDITECEEVILFTIQTVEEEKDIPEKKQSKCSYKQEKKDRKEKKDKKEKKINKIEDIPVKKSKPEETSFKHKNTSEKELVKEKDQKNIQASKSSIEITLSPDQKQPFKSVTAIPSTQTTHSPDSSRRQSEPVLGTQSRTRAQTRFVVTSTFRQKYTPDTYTRNIPHRSINTTDTSIKQIPKLSSTPVKQSHILSPIRTHINRLITTTPQKPKPVDTPITDTSTMHPSIIADVNTSSNEIDQDNIINSTFNSLSNKIKIPNISLDNSIISKDTSDIDQLHHQKQKETNKDKKTIQIPDISDIDTKDKSKEADDTSPVEEISDSTAEQIMNTSLHHNRKPFRISEYLGRSKK